MCTNEIVDKSAEGARSEEKAMGDHELHMGVETFWIRVHGQEQSRYGARPCRRSIEGGGLKMRTGEMRRVCTGKDTGGQSISNLMGWTA